MPRRWRPAAAPTAARGCVPTTRATTRPSCLIRTATTSRPCITAPPNAAPPRSASGSGNERRGTAAHASGRSAMKAQTALPQALYRTNLQLQARLAALLQDTARQWLDFWQRLVEEGVLESDAGLQALGRHDWQALAALPADAFWRQVQQRFGDQQAAAQVAVAVQAAFARGLQDAMRDWRR